MVLKKYTHIHTSLLYVHKKCFKALNGTKSGVLVQEEFVHLFKVLKPVLKKELKAMPCGEEANTLRQQLGLLKAFLKDSMMQELMWWEVTGGEGSTSQNHLDLPTFNSWLFDAAK